MVPRRLTRWFIGLLFRSALLLWMLDPDATASAQGDKQAYPYMRTPSSSEVEQARKALERLDSVDFRFTTRVSEVPEVILAQAGVIRVDEKLGALMTDTRERFAHGDVIFPGTLPLLLTFCGRSDRYLVLCYLHGGFASGCGFLLIGGLDTSPRTVLFCAELFCECKTLDEVKATLRRRAFQAVNPARCKLGF
jgi:hypothetical protein